LDYIKLQFVNYLKRALVGWLMKVYHSIQENIFVDLIWLYGVV